MLEAQDDEAYELVTDVLLRSSVDVLVADVRRVDL